MFKPGVVMIWLSLAMAAGGLTASERISCDHAAIGRADRALVKSDYQIRAAPFGAYEGYFYGF